MEEQQSNGMELERAAPRQQGMLSAEQSRAVQEVQASLVIAQNFRRDEVEVCRKITEACRRPQVAATAMYAFPRRSDGKNMTISGATIKLLRVIAQNWRNLEFGTKELSAGDGESTIEAFCWDKETNVREVRTISIRHERKAGGKVTKITDPRDVYEHVMSQAQRRVRACIEAVIPAYVVQEAVEACRQTLAKGDGKGPLSDRVRKLVAAFHEHLGVNQEMIERRLGHGVDLTTADQFVELHQIYNALKDGEQKRQDFFDFKTPSAAGVEDLNAKFGGAEAPAP